MGQARRRLGTQGCRQLGRTSAAQLTAHSRVSTFKLPQGIGARRSAIGSFEPSRRSGHASPTTRPGVYQTTPNKVSAPISSISTGLVMWWFGIMAE